VVGKTPGLPWHADVVESKSGVPLLALVHFFKSGDFMVESAFE
jgi:hypothetical protein